jgi:SOUL heme-binding protein
MATSETVRLAGTPSRPGFASEQLARLRGLLSRCLHRTPPLSGCAEPIQEAVIAHVGEVEIRQTATGWSLETCVKGEPGQARETAVKRLATYAAGTNSRHGRFGTVRPLVQMADVHGRWRVRIGIANTDTDLALTSARSGKVRVCVSEAKTIAVISVRGLPTAAAMQHAEADIRHAIATTRWEAAGPAMLRLDALPKLMPFLGRFEIAMPVVERRPGSTEPRGSRTIPLQEAATASSLPVH